MKKPDLETKRLRRQLKDAQELAPQWRSTSRELPDDGITVLIATTEDEVDAAFHRADRWHWETGHHVTAAVYAWAHMPAAPKTITT
jgi:hypothetical protein